jgi:hypothetical protein
VNDYEFNLPVSPYLSHDQSQEWEMLWFSKIWTDEHVVKLSLNQVGNNLQKSNLGDAEIKFIALD